MNKNRFFILLVIFISSLFLLSKDSARKLRSFAISTISPNEKIAIKGEQWEKLQTENQLYKLQLEKLRRWLNEEKQLERKWQQHNEEHKEEPFFQRRRKYLAKIIDKQLHSLPAQVIFREPNTWSSSIWINVGKRDNRALGMNVVAKNSPVVIGKTVIGVVETVAEKKSRVRLITDHKLHPSVRAIRGVEQNRILSEQIIQLSKLLRKREDLYGAKEIAEALLGFSSQLNFSEKELYLAKGELHGSSAPLWRVPSQKLKGEGFNYDFDDEEGYARDLRTGVHEGGYEPLIKVGDLLVTTGMDGIFPADLYVGIVTKIFPLHEGGYSYELEAEPLITNLNTLTEVFVLPPI